MMPLCTTMESSVVGFLQAQVAACGAAAVVLMESARATLEQFYLFGFIKWLMQK